MLVRIESAADAARLLRPAHPRFMLRAALRIPSLAPARAARWERGLNASLRACGCAEGSLGALLALAALLCWGIGHARTLDGHAFWWRALLVLVAGAAAGKIAGLSWARLRLVCIVAAIRRHERRRGGRAARAGAL
ncbi:MAG TPA: hypothetical protein VMD91_03755 [Candidatus Sulfotelmatobacter sp.]|nr:hypothetical protein [Candidatus Sulfotelmatobacter sp.]